MLQEKLEEPISEPPSPRQFADGEDAVGDLASHITSLREEIRRLKQQLAKSEADCKCSNVRVTRTDTALYGYLSRTTSARKYQTISGLRWGSRRGALRRWRSPPPFWVINEEFRDRRKAGWASKATRPLSSRSGSSTKVVSLNSVKITKCVYETQRSKEKIGKVPPTCWVLLFKI